MNRTNPTEIGVAPRAAYDRHELLFRALEQLYWVRFVPLDELAARSCRRLIRVGADGLVATSSGSPGLEFVSLGNNSAAATASGAVRFESDSALSPLLRGRTFRHTTGVRAAPLAANGSDRVLAQLAEQPVWVRRHLGDRVMDLLAFELPQLNAGETLARFYQRETFVQLLPLLHWLDEVTADSGWKRPPLRAAFMFDDPNLRWPSYGFINYRQLAAHARTHGYHASMATIPIDNWRVDPRAAALFREHPDQLSLLVHGNNHTHRELAGDYADAVRQGLVAQSLARIGKLERASGVPVARVMAAPHGACNEAMARSLALGGFESACISRGSLIRHNPEGTWNAAFGLRLAESLGDALPVFPRFALRRDCEFEIVMAAFLGQAIVPVGHHQDVRAGLDVLADIAGIINRLGPVKWCNLERISRSNFLHRIQGRNLSVRMFSRTVEVVVPAEVERIQIELPWLGKASFPEDIVVANLNGETLWSGPAAAAEFDASPAAGNRIVIRALPSAIKPPEVHIPSWKPWATLRRGLAEGRDRLLPLVPYR